MAQVRNMQTIEARLSLMIGGAGRIIQSFYDVMRARAAFGNQQKSGRTRVFRPQGYELDLIGGIF